MQSELEEQIITNARELIIIWSSMSSLRINGGHYSYFRLSEEQYYRGLSYTCRGLIKFEESSLTSSTDPPVAKSGNYLITVTENWRGVGEISKFRNTPSETPISKTSVFWDRFPKFRPSAYPWISFRECRPLAHPRLWFREFRPSVRVKVLFSFN